MRVLLVSPTLEVAGAERIVVALARHAAAQHHEVAVVAPSGPLEDELIPFGIACHHIARLQRSVLGAAGAAAAVARTIHTFRPTVIHAHNPKMTAIAAAARRLSLRRGAPLLTTFHGGEARDDRAAARLLRLADRLVCVEDELLTTMLANGCRQDRSQVIVNGVAPPMAADDPVLAPVHWWRSSVR
jgi:glycosyltransferase involved in cell wall biosynthesis